jgi:hypoxanthine-guanine phosphoribosyltransferase
MIPQVEIIDSKGSKLQSYIKRKVSQQNTLQIRVLKGAFFFWKFAYLLTRRSNWGDSKSGIKLDKISMT